MSLSFVEHSTEAPPTVAPSAADGFAVSLPSDGLKPKQMFEASIYNLASYSLVIQNPSGSLPAILAIDGNKNSCSKTQGLTIIFQVDLKKARAVTEIFVIFVEHITTVGDHIVYASNTSSSWKNGTVLHKGKALPAEVNFFTVFRYLTFEPLHLPQQPFVILELCEIGVIGCPPGHYGSNCTKSCPKKCQGPCEPENGNCTFGCISGWTGEKCGQACNGGKYGKDCLQECSANCLTPPCDHITGECSNGCNDGWLGSNCTQTCINGNFGTNCSDFCDGCLSFTCNHVDGLCADKNACNAGYVFGDYCNKECSIGQFATNCSEICKGCRSYMCDNADGLCDDTDTCNPGYFYGDYCNKACDNKRIIQVFKTSDWHSPTIPSTRIILDLLKSVVICSKSQNGPITVVCRDGCTKSGLFVALYLILDKMNIDEEIDIFQVVRNIQTRRPEFLKMCDQYEYCYRCIKEYLEGESLYANT
ncbi:Hypothetical predicted protein [Mytilus galloprovincialis]|uniref:Uncharacterized protein n=1 Tax=Mytilus galloprovincialis TaxID=29158 RepID=A0A8B6FMI2_MYTGA|nr:Hypothetical predicted protein [Mytilus galloprovincialis]